MCVYTYMHTWIYVYMHTDVYMYLVYTCTPPGLHLGHTRLNMGLRMCMYLHIYIYVLYIYIYVYICRCVQHSSSAHSYYCRIHGLSVASGLASHLLIASKKIGSKPKNWLAQWHPFGLFMVYCEAVPNFC